MPAPNKEIIARLNLDALQEDPICENLPGEKLDPETLKNKVLGHYQSQSGVLTTAIQGPELILRWRPSHFDEAAESLHHEAMNLVRSRQYARASEKWKHAIALNDEDPEYTYKLGLVLFEMKQFNESIQCLQKTIEVCPIHAKAYLVLGTAFLRNRKISDAEKTIYEAARLDHKNKLVLLHLATVYSIQKKFNEAIDLFSEVIKQSPNEIRAHLGLAKINHILGDFKRSNQHFQKVIELAPGTKMADYARRSLHVENAPMHEVDVTSDEVREEQISEGIQQYILGEYKKAANNYQNYLKLRPSDHYVWFLLGETKLRSGESHEALDCFKKALRINSKRGLYYKSFGIALYYVGMPTEAQDAFKKAIELGKNDPLTRTLYGINLLRKRKTDAAIEEFNAALKRDPNNPLAMYHLALTHIQSNQKNEAAEMIKRLQSYENFSPLKDQAAHLIQNIS